MMIPIMLAFAIGVMISLERGWFFLANRGGKEPEHMLDLIRRGKMTDALALAEQHQNPVLAVLGTGIMHRQDDPAKAMMSRGLGEIGRMKRGLPVLDTIITLGPLLGLLGTIIGMIDSFGIMATGGLGQTQAVTGGVAEALICTAAGIFVAVIILIPYNYFQAYIEGETERIELFATQAETAFTQLT
ncbi:MAG: MotA/TolQ/ExbB proton channel family protein [Nitrospirales bacterium]|nr:MotA/TolQ/ExbB proton channel family protein [Nitrospira sp.]MDR4501816.1 MotA/TolQ/ExbB proton channel family protein [Nitrospirales bacterium]